MYPWRGLGFDIHYRFICMMDATQCVSRMQRQQGQSCLRTKVSLLPVASRRNNDRECPRTAGTAPNTIPYVLPSTSSFYSLGPLSTKGEREGERETSLFPFPSSARLLPLLPLLAPCFFTAFSFQQPSSVYPFVGMCFSVSLIFAFAFCFVVVQPEFNVFSKILDFSEKLCKLFHVLFNQKTVWNLLFYDWLIALDKFIELKKRVQNVFIFYK